VSLSFPRRRLFRFRPAGSVRGAAGRAVRGGRFYSGVVSWFVADDTVLVADGGLATELEARGNDLSDSLWSARLLAAAPEQILDAHLAFFRAGAVIATSASYQASPEGFARRGLDRGQAAGLTRRSVDLARAARDQMAADGRAQWVS